MSTRATVWIRSDESDVSRFIYHHCDGYCLDEDIDPALKKVKDWYVPEVVQAVLDIEDAYREVNGVGWDSEYVYKIDVDERKMYKYDTGIGSPRDEENFESRLTDLERTYEYQPEKRENEDKEELSPLAAKLKEIVNSYDEDHSMTNEGAEFYANQLRPLLEEKKEVRCELDDYPDPADFQGMNAQTECQAHGGVCENCPHNLENTRKRFNEATMAQILHIQLTDLVKYCCKWLSLGAIPNSEVDKIQKLFKTLNEK